MLSFQLPHAEYSFHPSLLESFLYLTTCSSLTIGYQMALFALCSNHLQIQTRGTTYPKNHFPELLWNSFLTFVMIVSQILCMGRLQVQGSILRQKSNGYLDSHQQSARQEDLKLYLQERCRYHFVF